MAQPDFVSACYGIRRARRTGVLQVQAEGVRTFLYFKEGTLVFAEAGTLGETLGRILVQHERLTQEQYTWILERMTEGLIQNEQVRFGEIAVELGFLTPQQVDDALREQVRRKFVHCLQWHAPGCFFLDGADEVAHLPAYPWALEPLILDGVRKHFDEWRFAMTLEPAELLYPALREDAQDVARQFLLDARGLRFLLSLDGSKPIGAHLATPMGAEMRPVLVALMITNAVRLTATPVIKAPATPEPAPAAPPSEDSVLFFLPEGQGTRPADPAPATAPEAPALPADPAPPPSVQVKAARLEAEQAFQRGTGHLAAEEWPAAVRELRRAASLYPDVAEYELAAAWAEFRAGAGGNEAALRGRRARLKDLATGTIAQDAAMPLAHHALGHVLALEGDDAAAGRELRTALRLEPDNVDVKRQLLVLERRAQERATKGTPRPRASATGRKSDAADVSLMLEHATVARSSGQLDTALELLRKALAAAPGNPEVTAELALTLLQQGPENAREANAMAREARKANPQLPIPWVVLGLLLESIGHSDRAAQMARHALELDPECSEAERTLERLGRRG